MPPELERVAIGGRELLPAVVALARSCPESPMWTRAVWAEFLEPDSGRVPRRILFASGEGGQLRGLLAASLFKGTAELELLVVHPESRRQGVGRRLLEVWLRWCAAQGVGEALLEVRASNEAARRLYESFGFAEQGRRKGYYLGPMEDAVLMRCAVKPEVGWERAAVGEGSSTRYNR